MDNNGWHPYRLNFKRYIFYKIIPEENIKASIGGHKVEEAKWERVLLDVTQLEVNLLTMEKWRWHFQGIRVGLVKDH